MHTSRLFTHKQVLFTRFGLSWSPQRSFYGKAKYLYVFDILSHPKCSKHFKDRLYLKTMARISPERLKELKKLLKEQTGRDHSDEEAQEAGLAIMRFVLAKEQRRHDIKQKTKDKTLKSK